MRSFHEWIGCHELSVADAQEACSHLSENDQFFKDCHVLLKVKDLSRVRTVEEEQTTLDAQDVTNEWYFVYKSLFNDLEDHLSKALQRLRRARTTSTTSQVRVSQLSLLLLSARMRHRHAELDHQSATCNAAQTDLEEKGMRTCYQNQ